MVKRFSNKSAQNLYPVRFAQSFYDHVSNTDYPYYVSSDGHSIDRFISLLEKTICAHISFENSDDIQNWMEIIHSGLSQKVREQIKPFKKQQFSSFLQEILPSLPAIENYKVAFENVCQDLVIQVDELYELSNELIFKLLNLQLQNSYKTSFEFQKRIRKVTNALSELILLQGNVSDPLGGQLDFADEMISFDQIRDIAVASVSSHLPEKGLNRARIALKTLVKSQQFLSDRPLSIITSEAFDQTYNIKRFFGHTLQITSGPLLHQARIQSDEYLEQFVQTMAAIKMGELMIDQKYDPLLHDHYFDDFDLTNLSEEDLKYLPVYIIIADSQHIMEQSNDFLALLSNMRFVKVLGINSMDDLFFPNKTIEPNYLELASLAIFRRSSYVYQGTLDQPANLNNSLNTGLDHCGSAFWNVLILGKSTFYDSIYDKLRGATESRYFPCIEYKVSDIYFEHHQIDLGANLDHDKLWTSFDREAKIDHGIQKEAHHFTIFDFLCLDTDIRKILEIVDPQFRSDQLIPLPVYLSKSPEDSQGMIPFIWMVDFEQRLYRVVMPLASISLNTPRMEYWRFLQSLAGIHIAHLETTVDKLKSEWDHQKLAEIESLRIQLNAEFDQQKSAFLQQAIYNILYGFLDNNNSIEQVLVEMSQADTMELKGNISGELTKTTLSEETTTEPLDVVKTKAIKAEAWVESDECTSCQDCLDALPSVFKYDDNKQAYVHNPKGGSFAQIVMAAEKCPARCIHPGVPQNRDEPSLDKWIKRAKKYN